MSIMQLDEGIHAFLRFLKAERRASPRTIQAYQSDLGQFESFLKGRAMIVDPKDVDVYAIRGYVASLVGRKNKPRTVGRKVAAIRSLYRFLLREGVVRLNPSKELRSPKIHASIPKLLTKDEADALMEMPEGQGTQAVRDRAILETLYSTGARVSELVAMNWADVQWEEGTVLFRGSGDKERRSPIGEVALESLATYRQTMSDVKKKDSEAVFLNRYGTRLSAQSVGAIVSLYSHRMPRGRITTRGLRHSFAIHLLNEGADVPAIQEMLGLASLGSLQKCCEPGVEQLLRVYQENHPRAKANIPK